ncbi:MAG: ion transporter [Longicatena sp.]
MRDRICSIIERADGDDFLSKFYDYFIMVVALISLIPIMFRGSNFILEKIDVITVYILFFDYILRWMVFDKLSKKKAPWAFIIYPFTFFALVDFVSILPSLGLVAANQAFRALRVLRVFKVLHYSKSFTYVNNVFHKQKDMLLSVLLISVAYIFISALIMFAIEEKLNNFFEALYWATTALTTVGYGDVYPVTAVGRSISMFSSLFGIAVIALPAGIITSGFMEELHKEKDVKKSKEDIMREEMRAEIMEELKQSNQLNGGTHHEEG